MSTTDGTELAEDIVSAENSSQESNTTTVVAAPRTPPTQCQPPEACYQSCSPSDSSRAADYINARIRASQPQSYHSKRYKWREEMMPAIFEPSPLFSFNEPHEMTNYWLVDCDTPTCSSDSKTVICPRCGDYSWVRYCSITHLLLDIRDHFVNHCGRRRIYALLDDRTVPPLRASFHPFIRVTNKMHDSIERHRQALYHAYPPELDTSSELSDSLPDYYVFDDADLFDATNLPVTAANLRDSRGSGRVVARVHFPDWDLRKERLAILLEVLLGLGVSAGRTQVHGCRRLFFWIRENLVGQKVWSEAMMTRVCLAMQLEFGWRVAVDLRDEHREERGRG